MSGLCGMRPPKHDCDGTCDDHREKHLPVRSSIWTAAASGHIGRVQTLLQGGTDPNSTDEYGYTALHYAARLGDVRLVELLLQHGAQVDPVTKAGKSTPLHRAAFCGHLEVVKILIKAGALAHRTDADGVSAERKAKMNGHIAVHDYLISCYTV
eukprot:CAMPEP_0196652872 /NCGR_PEP_ID=MMETSP1086-20130531/2334_1 /TAXON_ID=77921 /ORGANISM="Cyanoptyche  gloeocystis , Strain SAG4.97" /LENGTH=153 /DNA_ID=CAMNT_0041983687 /DNA_START=17 /DNA_END=478 /DNA_ORIENTATION=-